MSDWSWAIVGRPQGLRVELPDGRAAELVGPLPAAVAALLAWAAGPEGCGVPPVAPSRPGSTSRDVVASADGSAKSTNAARQARHRERLRLAKLGASVTQGVTHPVTEGVTRNAPSVTSNAQSVTPVTPPAASRALSDQDLVLLSSSDSPSFSANSSLSSQEEIEIARTSAEPESVTRNGGSNALDVTGEALREGVTRNAGEAERIPPGLVLVAAPTLAQTKANAKLAAHAERERLRAEKDAAKLRAVQARAELESARQAARDAKTAALPRSAPLSVDWAPTEGHAVTAAKRNLALDLQADRFRAHAEEKRRVFRDRRHEDACFTSWLLSRYAQPEPSPSAGRSWGRQGRPTQQDPPGIAPFRTGVWEPEPQTPEQDAADEVWMRSRKGAAK